ncbi:MAG TPA: phosphoglycolate phosphatase, partial [Thauera sp.]|nr:phosphoglycolate phosphatase [Thauera sp.]
MSTARFAPRAVLFDLDGTLLDTIADLADAANLTLAELGRPARSQDEIHSFVGKGIPHLVRRCMIEGTSATEAEIETAVTVFRRHYAVVNGARTTIYPGVIETLQTLRARDIRLAVVTNKAEAFTLPLLARMEIAHYFDTVVSGDTLAVKKPDPAVVRLACERLEVAPTE